MRASICAIFIALAASSAPAKGDEPCNSPAPAPASCYYVRGRPASLYQQFLRQFSISDAGAYRIALLTGVSEYADNRIPPLVWAHRDLIKLFNALRDQHLFDEIIVLENKSFSVQNLGVWLNGPISERIKLHDRVQFLFAFSGHGIQRKTRAGPASGMLLVENSNNDHIERDAISFETLKSLLQPVVDLAFQSLILVNACYSGNMLPSEFGNGLYDPDKRGAHVITAGETGELTFAISTADDAGSVFFDAFLEGLRGYADLSSGDGRDGIITVDEIARYVRETVKVWTRGAQTPGFTYFSPGSRGGFFFWSEDKQVGQKTIQVRREFALMDKFSPGPGPLPVLEGGLYPQVGAPPPAPPPPPPPLTLYTVTQVLEPVSTGENRRFKITARITALGAPSTVPSGVVIFNINGIDNIEAVPVQGGEAVLTRVLDLHSKVTIRATYKPDKPGLLESESSMIFPIP